MKIYTSNYANHEMLVRENICVVGVSRWAPRWFTGYNLKYVAPSEDLLRRYKSGQTDKEGYIAEFKEMLRNRDCNRFVKNLQIISGGRDVAIVCYEKYGQFCHRHLVAEWIEDEMGIEVVEWDDREAKSQQAWNQLGQAWVEALEETNPALYHSVMG